MTFKDYIDIDYSHKIIDTLSAFGDDPDTGNRMAGSPALTGAGEFLYEQMKEIGLSNVTKDEFTAAGWTYKGGRIDVELPEGGTEKILLGGFATSADFDDEPCEIVFAGEGTADDYEGLDVKGKIVIATLDANEKWWPKYPMSQAKKCGAKALLVYNTGSYAQRDPDDLATQDISGPADFPLFSISKNSYNLLKKIAEQEGCAKGKITARSIITEESTSFNVWGEIPGETDYVIMMISHYDGYYHSQFDDASGVAKWLSIAKAFVESGVKPNKTLRFMAHSAEEWGIIDNYYDWAYGAFKQITEIHPEWKDSLFMIFNDDIAFPIEGATDLGINTSYEIRDFVRNITPEAMPDGRCRWHVQSSFASGTEDFSYSQKGIPIVSTGGTDESRYYDNCLHSTGDTKEFGFDNEIFKYMHSLYGSIILSIDKLNVIPMDFSLRAAYFEEALSGIEGFDEQKPWIDAIAEQGRELKATLDKINGEVKPDERTRQEVNKTLRKAYQFLDNHFVKLEWNDEIIIGPERYNQNIKFLEEAKQRLLNGDNEGALFEQLGCVDANKHEYFFDRDICQYYIDQMIKPWNKGYGTGYTDPNHEDLYEVIDSLLCKDSSGSADYYADEIKLIDKAIVSQKARLAESMGQVSKWLEAAYEEIKSANSFCSSVI